MTYNEFLTGTYQRMIAPGYFITKKGKIWSDSTKKFLTTTNGKTALYIDGKVKVIINWIALVKAFPDVDIPVDIKRSALPRGAYSWNIGHKPWRAMARFDGKLHTLGYFDNKEAAQSAYYTAYSLVRGHKPW